MSHQTSVPLHRRLAVRISLLILLLEGLVLGLIGWYYVSSYWQQVDQRSEIAGELPGRLMRQGALRYAVVRDLPALCHLTGQEVQRALVLEPDGRIFESSQPLPDDHLQVAMVEPNFPTLFTLDPQRADQFATVTTTGHVHHVLSALASEGRHIGWLYLTIDARRAEDEKRRLALRYAAATAASILLTWLSIVLLVGRMTEPRITRTIAVLDRAREGDLAARIAGGSDDELGRLQRGVDDLLAAVAARTAERDQSAIALVERERDLRITLDSIGDGVIATDATGLITRLNPVAEGLTGWASSEAAGRPLAEVFRIFQARTREVAADPVARVLATGQVMGLPSHTVLVRRDGQEAQIADSAAPIRDADGTVRGVVLVFRDISHEHELEDRLRHSQKMDAIGQLAGGVAHDFNNLLTAIIGGCDLAASQPLTPVQEKGVTLANNAAMRAADLTRRLLTFARKGQTTSAPIDLGAVLRATVALLERTVDRKITVRAEVPGTALTVLGDTAQLQSAMLNLGVNARDAMPEGGELTYALRRTVAGDGSAQCEILVTDTGHGIAPADLPRIFEPFFTTKEVGRGTGLGLSVVYTTVQEHGGTIDVDSIPGRGTVFTITLPLSDGAPVVAADTPPRMVPGRGTILVIDDEPALRMLAQALLESLGYSVLLACDGHQGVAIHTAQHEQIAAVLLDMVMPGMSGRETFHALRATVPGVRVVICSGFDRSGAIEELLAQGAAAFVQKPYHIHDLSQVLAGIVPAKPG
jgi:PAS domain S-box-containing protein